MGEQIYSLQIIFLIETEYTRMALAIKLFDLNLDTFKQTAKV